MMIESLLVCCRLVSGSNLTVSSVRLSDSGNYVCTVTDSTCTSETVVNVNVVWGQNSYLLTTSP